MSTSAEEASIQAVSPLLGSDAGALAALGVAAGGLGGVDGACAIANEAATNRHTAAPKHRNVVLITISSSAQIEPI
jgi:hypothetical protein